MMFAFRRTTFIRCSSRFFPTDVCMFLISVESKNKKEKERLDEEKRKKKKEKKKTPKDEDSSTFNVPFYDIMFYRAELSVFLFLDICFKSNIFG